MTTNLRGKIGESWEDEIDKFVDVTKMRERLITL